MLRNETITVKYYYIYSECKVVEQHIDVKTNQLLEEEVVHTGNEGDTYKIEAKEFDGYDLVEQYLPENAEGTMTVKEIIVKYYYIRKTYVQVEYLEYESNKKLAEDTIINGHEEQEYKTEAKEIDGYELLENMLPENKDGYMTSSPIKVTYYYKAIEEKPNTPDDTKDPEENNGNNNNDNNSNNNNDTNNNNNSGNSSNSNNNNQNNNTNNSNSNNANVNNTNTQNSTSNKSQNTTNTTNNTTSSNTNNTNTTANTENEETTKVPYTGDNTPVITIFIMILVIFANIIVNFRDVPKSSLGKKTFIK